jgi:hypothetical protein
LASGAELYDVLEEHINRVRLMKSKLEMLEGLKTGRDGRSLYKDVADEIARRIELFNGGMDVLLCLTDECTALLRRSHDIHPSVSEAEGERPEGLRRCIACGRSNPREVNFCTSCATKLPALDGRLEGDGLPLPSWREKGTMSGQRKQNGNAHVPRYGRVRLLI